MGVELSRRKLLQAGSVALTSAFVPKALAKLCGGLTPAQTPGPFYPGEPSFHRDNDLTTVNGKKALGQVIYIQGTITDQNCHPVAGAAVEIWQACASGKYNNPTDPNTAPLDPNFKYWGETFTDTQGKYVFKSIIPGAYPADVNWMRPPHVHFKISKLGYKELITQMYFKGNKYNEADLILRDVPAGERERVIVDFIPAGSGMEPEALSGEFDIAVQKILF